MSDTNGPQAETTESTERKPPTIADLVRQKTGDGALIIDFFTDVMTGRIEGAELCHRIDVAKQLVKYGSKDAAEFLAKYKGVPCGHSTRGRPNQADPCSAPERTLVEVTLNAPPTLTREFLTVLSGIDEFLMTTLIRAQTADGDTIIEFLDDVMQDRADGFKTHHRIAAAKELIVHIVRDEQPEPTPREPDPEQSGIPAQAEGNPDNTTVVPAKAGTQGRGGDRTTAANPAHPEPVLSTVEGPNTTVVPAQTEGNPDNLTVVPAKSLPRTRYGAGTHPSDPALSSVEGPDETPPSVVPAESLPRTRYGAGIQGRGGDRTNAANPARTDPREIVVPEQSGTHPSDPALSSVEGPDETPPSVVPAESLPRTRYGAGTQGRGGDRTNAANPARTDPDPYGAPIDSTHPGRSPPC